MEMNPTVHDDGSAVSFDLRDDIEKEWANVDFKTLIALLTLADSPISQAKVAQSVGISPVTLSRILNSNDPSIRDSWIPALSELLTTLDINAIKRTIDTLQRIKIKGITRTTLQQFIPAIGRYTSESGLEDYKYDPEFWGLSSGILRFVSSDGSQWYFGIGRESDSRIWREKRKIGPFLSLTRMKSITSEDRISLVYSYKSAFSDSVTWGSKSTGVNPYIKYPCYLSLMLFDSEQQKIVEEYVVSDIN